MKNTNTTTAEALAANFQVAELEPRLENVWAGDVGMPDTSPQCPSGGAPDGNGSCN